MYQIKGQYPKYIKNSYKSMTTTKKIKQSDFKMGRGTEETSV